MGKENTAKRTSESTRRTFLKYAGTATAVAAAGCAGDEGDSTESGNGNQDEANDDSNATDSQDQRSITITISQPPDTLDPQNSTDIPAHNVFLQAYDTILSRDSEGATEASIATDWKRIEPGRFRLTIRDGVTFHNGDALTPEDVAYSINRTVDPDVGIASPKASNIIGVTGAEVAGDKTVDVLSNGFNPLILPVLAGYLGVAVVQRSWIEERNPSEIALEMNGTGPYQLEEYTEDVETRFHRFDNYWGKQPDIAEVTFNQASEASVRASQLLTGESDLTVNVSPEDVPRIQDNDETRIEAAPSQRILFGGFRYDVEPFSNKDFRRALNYAIDLDSIVENVLQGFGGPTGQPTLEGFFGHNPEIEPYSYDPELAEQLVEDSGFAGAEIEFETPTGRYLKDVEIAQAAAGYINDLPNVSCEAIQRDFGSIASEIVDGDIESTPPFFLIGWGNPTFDASQSITPWLTTDGSLSHFSDEKVDEVLDESNRIEDREQREEALQELNAMLHEKAPWLFLNRQTSIYAVNDDLEWEARMDEFIDVSEITR